MSFRRMTTCKDMECLLSVYIDGETTGEETRMVDAHLHQCDACRATMTEFSTLHTWYRNLEQRQAPADFRPRVTQRVTAAPRVAFWRQRFPRPAYALAMAVVMLFGVVMMTSYVAKKWNQPTWEQQTLSEAEIYAEDILFVDQPAPGINDVLSSGDMGIAEEMLDNLELSEPDTSFLNCPSFFETTNVLA